MCFPGRLSVFRPATTEFIRRRKSEISRSGSEQQAQPEKRDKREEIQVRKGEGIPDFSANLLVRGVTEKPLHRPARLDARPFFWGKVFFLKTRPLLCIPEPLARTL